MYCIIFSNLIWNRIRYIPKLLSMNLANVIINCFRTLPLGSVGGMTVITLLYLGVNVAYFAVLGIDDLMVSSAVAEVFYSSPLLHLFHEIFYVWVSHIKDLRI